MSAWAGGGGCRKASCLGCSAHKADLPGGHEDILKRCLCPFGYQTVKTMDPQEIRNSPRNVMQE